MAQWLVEKGMVALNTMCRKPLQKQVTHRTTKGVEKQLDYIMTDRTEVSGAKKAEDKDEEILALIQERMTIKKDEKERIREVSKKIKKCIREKRGMQVKTKFRRFWKNSQRKEEHLECQPACS